MEFNTSKMISQDDYDGLKMTLMDKMNKIDDNKDTANKDLFQFQLEVISKEEDDHSNEKDEILMNIERQHKEEAADRNSGFVKNYLLQGL